MSPPTVLPAKTPAAAAGPAKTDIAALLDEPTAHAWYRRPALWAGVLLLALAAAGLWWWQRATTTADPSVTVTQVEAFGDDYDGLWERARGSYAMCVRRDASYLEWKFVRCPHKKYDLREVRREGELVGYAVSRDEDYRGLRLGWRCQVESPWRPRSPMSITMATRTCS